MRKIKRIRLEDLESELRSLPDKIAIAAERGLDNQNIVELAKINCPVMTGALRDSIRYIKATILDIVFLAGGFQYINPLTGKYIDYARYVHDGTSKMPPRPFLLQAIISERYRVRMEIRQRTLEMI